MADYTLYYWPVPFRGEFVRALLAFAGKTWDEPDADAISDLMSGATARQPVPFTGPPVLVDRSRDVALAQMPAIVLYLGETLRLLPRSSALRAMSLKVVNDANDVIDELTLDGGRQMWTEKSWQDFIPRLQHWMGLWEDTGRRHGLKANKGFLLGGRKPGIADIVTATLWSTMTDRLPPIAPLLEEAAPHTAALARRVSALPALAAQFADSKARFGETYCGGQIEASLRKVLKT
ncbi:glutathione S-transferase [Azorhizobium oxalatiphilum]|uniref:Glutathione S-transferase n=1 Tax=Azorhizobium oxalatiphilum TaxID=980631 RepID=A0A917F9G5_9HYPH|nr:glutathione S-transferase [Azorhizobium oxalatiphilum]GGF57655.1 glutathione S-transferase [Azorhizobium oxalatiphilum]